jgi:hypothetical protein
MLVVRADDGTCFEIPGGVVEAGRIAGDGLEELGRLGEAGDVSSFTGGVVLPYAGDHAAYALPRETIARYRVSPERAAELASATASDVAGYLGGTCPPGYMLVFVPFGFAPGGQLKCVRVVSVPDSLYDPRRLGLDKSVWRSAP